MTTKLGREQIQQLLRDAVEKYEQETGEEIKRNQTVTNYTGLANKLSEISNRLPADYPNNFEQDRGGRYDITTAQIRDALFGKVDSLKLHFSEALHLYVYGKPGGEVSYKKEQDKGPAIEPDPPVELIPPKEDFRKKSNILKAVCAILLLMLLLFMFKWCTVRHEFSIARHQLDSVKNRFDTINKDMKILPYQPSKAEIQSLEGIYKVYSGSPQVRTVEPDRYHKVAEDILEVKYKGAYFTFKRYGPIFNHEGFMQFVRPNLVSIYTNVSVNDLDTIVPKYSLFELVASKNTFNVMSVSWSWDTTNIIIGIREVYNKIGKDGYLVETPPFGNTPKIVKWKKKNRPEENLQPKFVRLESLPTSIQPLLDEKSIILKDLDSTLFAKDPKKMKGN